MKIVKILIPVILMLAVSQCTYTTSGGVIVGDGYGPYGGVSVGFGTGVYPYGSWCYNYPYSAQCGYGYYGFGPSYYGGYYRGGYGRGYRGGYKGRHRGGHGGGHRGGHRGGGRGGRH